MNLRRVLKWGSISLGALVAVAGISAALWWYRPWMPAPAFTPESELRAAVERIRTSTTLFPQPRDASVWPAWEEVIRRADELRTASRRTDPQTGEFSKTEGESALITLRNINPTGVPSAREQLSSPEVLALLAELDRLADGPAPMLPIRDERVTLSYQILASDASRNSSASRHYLMGRLGLAGLDRLRPDAIQAFRSYERFCRLYAAPVSSLDLLKLLSASTSARREMQMQMLESRWSEAELAELDRVCRESMPDHAGWVELTSAVRDLYRLQFTSGTSALRGGVLLSERSERAFAHRWAEKLGGRSTDIAAMIQPPAAPDPSTHERSTELLNSWFSGSRVTPEAFEASQLRTSQLTGVVLRRTYLSGLGTRVMIAIQRHQIRTGALPTSLAEIPADLWSGSVPPLEAYEYRVNPDGTFHLAVRGPGKPEMVTLSMPRAEYMKPRPNPFASDEDNK